LHGLPSYPLGVCDGRRGSFFPILTRG
jgi:hypothetical protein